MSGPHVEKWTYSMVWVQIDGVVDGLNYATNLTDPEPDGFDLITEPPFGELAQMICPGRGTRIKCETYPIVHTDKPNEVNPDFSGDQASAALGLPSWSLPKKSASDLFYMNTGDGRVVVGNGVRIRLTGHLMIENGHPDQGSPWLELHPFDYSSIISLDNPPRPAPPDCSQLQQKVDNLNQSLADIDNELSDPSLTAEQRGILARRAKVVAQRRDEAQAALNACLQQSKPDPRRLLHPSGHFGVLAPVYSSATYTGLPGGNVDLRSIRTSCQTHLKLTYPTSSTYSLSVAEQIVENSTGSPVDQVRNLQFDPNEGSLEVTAIINSKATTDAALLSQRNAFHATYSFTESPK